MVANHFVQVTGDQAASGLKCKTPQSPLEKTHGVERHGAGFQPFAQRSPVPGTPVGGGQLAETAGMRFLELFKDRRQFVDIFAAQRGNQENLAGHLVGFQVFYHLVERVLDSVERIIRLLLQHFVVDAIKQRQYCLGAHGEEQLGLVVEMPIDAAACYSRRGGNVFQCAFGDATLGKNPARSINNLLPGPLRFRLGFSNHFLKNHLQTWVIVYTHSENVYPFAVPRRFSMDTRVNQPSPSRVLVCLASAAAVLLAAGCARETPAAVVPQALPVSVMEARFEQVPFALEAVGQAEGSREVEVRARVGGILVKRLYQEGSTVKAGQALFEIDKAPYEIALAQARGQLAEQKARVEQATREAARLKGLLNQRAISQKEYDDATSNYAVAEAGVQSAEAAVHQAALNLSYATVTAPVGGIAGRAEHSEGALINTGADSLLTGIVQANPLWVRFGVADADLAALRGVAAKRRAISKVEALLTDGSTYVHPGRLNFESAEVDRRLGTVTLRAEFDNPDGTLIPGQFVRVRLLAGQRSAVLVPQSAALQTDHGTTVFVVGSDSSAQPRPIKTDGWSGSNWVVTSGLQPGDRVIIDNLLKLKPGAPVKVDMPNGTKAAPAAKP